MTRHPPPATRHLLLFLLLLAFTLRVYRLDHQELRGDEVFGYFFSLRPVGDMAQATIDLQEPHPIASYVIQHYWLAWAGQSEFALRFLSVWYGIVAIALLYRLARRLDLPLMTALLTTALLAISPYVLWHSQDARMYTLSLALTLASTGLAVEWWQRQRWPWAVGWLAVSWLALHTHYFSVFVLLAQSGFMISRALVLPRLRGTAVNWLTWEGILAVLYLPWLAQISPILGSYDGNGDSPTLVAALARALSVFAVGESTPATQRGSWALLALLLMLLGLFQLIRQGPNGRRTAWLLLCYLLLPLLATWYSAQSRPIFNERYLVAAVPPFYLLVAAALSWVADFALRSEHPQMRAVRPARSHLRMLTPRYLLVTLSPCLLVLILLIGNTLSLHRHYTDPVYSKTRGWRELAVAITQFSAQLPAERVRIAQNFPDPTLWYYYKGPVAHVVLPPAAQDRPGAERTVAQLAAAEVERILLPIQPAPNWDDQQIAASVLATQYQLVGEQPIGVWPLQVYVRPSDSLAALAVKFQNGVSLTGLAFQPARLQAGDLLAVYLAWRGEAARLHGTEKVFVQLLNVSGQLVAQQDQPLAISELSPMRDQVASYGILLPDPLPAGDYRLIVGLYDPGQAGAPRVSTVGGGDFVELEILQAVSSDS